MSADPDLDGVIRWVGGRAGLHFPDYRRAAVDRAVRQGMADRRVNSPADYLALLRGDAAALGELLDRLTVGETYFFREPAQFDAIRGTILPDVLRRIPPGEPVRAWSAGCSTGEEAYSLAVVLIEAGLERRAEVVATDLSPAALAQAARGEYRDWSFRGDGGRRILPYLVPRGASRVVTDRVRRLVRFEPLNLAAPEYPAAVAGPPGRDLIMCRNVLIYFDPATVAAVARRLFDALAPGGWLVTASCDPPLAEYAPFAGVATPAGIAYRREPAAEVAPRTYSDAVLASGGRQPPGGSAGIGRTPSTGGLTPPARQNIDYSPSTQKVERTRPDTDAAWLQEVRGLADRDAEAAEAACASAARRFPLSVELRLTHAVLLLGLGRLDEAARAARGAVFLAPDAAVVHHTFGLLLTRTGDRPGAGRAFRQARDLAAAAPAAEPIRFGRGETAADLVRAADAQLAQLARAGGGP